MKQIEREYLEKYGAIAEDAKERLDDFISAIRNYDTRVKPVVEKEIERIKGIKWHTQKYVIYLIPKGTPRPRLGARGVFYVKGAKDNKKMFEAIVKDKDNSLITTATKFYCDSYLPIPQSMAVYERVLAEMKIIRPQSTPDWDNLGKAYCDMIQGLLLYDDSLVIEGVSRKFYSLKPRVEIRVCYMDDFDSSYNKKKMLRKAGTVK